MSCPKKNLTRAGRSRHRDFFNNPIEVAFIIFFLQALLINLVTVLENILELRKITAYYLNIFGSLISNFYMIDFINYKT
ncbi:hypothetical protein PMI10_01612 [Flavobacterium sp. CF136]|nr:hypothetical protein PMI10_01612 [Flavobacterium sp. CF136]